MEHPDSNNVSQGSSGSASPTITTDTTLPSQTRLTSVSSATMSWYQTRSLFQKAKNADGCRTGFKKAVNRAGTQVMMKTGHVEKTVDRDYEIEERRYRTMESAANKLQKEAKGYLDSLRGTNPKSGLSPFHAVGGWIG
jgi:hypothetical protein